MSQVTDGSVDEIDAARQAFGEHDWPTAYEHYTLFDEAGTLEAADLERFGEAAWWLARLEEAISIRERAYAAHVKEGNNAAAAIIACWLVLDYTSRLQHTLAAGALTRAQRLLVDEPEGRAHAWLATIRAATALPRGELEEAAELAREAEVISARLGDGDLESVALLVQGEVLVAQGQVTEGLAILDRAVVSAVAGELEPMTTGVIYCSTIATCTDIADYRRAGEWTDAAERWCAQQAMPSGFPGVCRVRRAEIKRVGGEWSEAEEEARRAVEELQGSFLDTAGAAYYEIGEIRLRLGDLDAAEEAFASAHNYGHDAQPGRSRLLLLRGRTQAATASIRSALDNPFLTPLVRGKLLPAQVEIALAAGDGETAAAGAEELERIAEDYDSPSPVLRAVAATARAQVAVSKGDAETALSCARAALRDWRQARAPYDVARAQVVLAEAYRLRDDEEAATFELRAAKTAFERLGAAPDVRRADELLAGPTRPAHVTRAFLFTDIVTSTDLIELIGDDAWADLVRWHDQTLRQLFAEHAGQEVEHTGDGFFVAFDSAEAALACAVGIQRRLRGHRQEHGFAPKVRIGVHAAEAVQDSDGYRGKGVHVAARIAALAEGGEVLASRATAEEAGGGFGSSPPRIVQLKGVTDSVEIVEVDWTGKHA